MPKKCALRLQCCRREKQRDCEEDKLTQMMCNDEAESCYRRRGGLMHVMMLGCVVSPVQPALGMNQQRLANLASESGRKSDVR